MSFEPLEIQHLRHALHVSETLATARLKEREDYQRIAYEHSEEIKRLKKQLGISTDQQTTISNDQVQDLKEELDRYKSATEYWHSAVGSDAKFFMERTEVKDDKIRELKKELDTCRRFEEWVAQWCDDRLPNADHTKDVSLREQLNAVWERVTERSVSQLQAELEVGKITNSGQVVEQLQRNLEAAQQENDKLKAALNRAVGYGTDRGADERAASGKVVEALQNEVGRLTRELEAAQQERDNCKSLWMQGVKQLDAANKAAAEMRKCLLVVASFCRAEDPNWTDLDGDVIDHALGYDCGKNYVSRESVQPLVEVLKSISDTQPAHDGSVGLFYPRFDGDGNEVGCEQVDPVGLLNRIYELSRTALETVKQLGLGGEK